MDERSSITEVESFTKDCSNGISPARIDNSSNDVNLDERGTTNKIHPSNVKNYVGENESIASQSYSLRSTSSSAASKLIQCEKINESLSLIINHLFLLLFFFHCLDLDMDFYLDLVVI